MRTTIAQTPQGRLGLFGHDLAEAGLEGFELLVHAALGDPLMASSCADRSAPGVLYAAMDAVTPAR
jgi:hypothetical protein